MELYRLLFWKISISDCQILAARLLSMNFYERDRPYLDTDRAFNTAFEVRTQIQRKSWLLFYRLVFQCQLVNGKCTKHTVFVWIDGLDLTSTMLFINLTFRSSENVFESEVELIRGNNKTSQKCWTQLLICGRPLSP